MYDNLEVFAVVVEQESLNKATRVLNLSQPALSRKIMHLEEELGVALFDRKGKRLELTRAGHLCYEHAMKMRALNEEFMQSLRPFTTDATPKSITIGASLTTLQSTLPELIHLFTTDFPETDIKAVTGKTHEIVGLVREKKVDFGLIASEIDHPELECYPLFDDHLCLVLPEGHLYVGRSDLSMEDLNELPMILFSKGTWYRVLMDELFERHASYPNVKMEIDSFEAILRLGVTLGCATLLPASYLSTKLMETSGMTVTELPELAKAKRTTCLILYKEAALQPSIRSFIDRTKGGFPSAPLLPGADRRTNR
ncbi:LysR family transcriptional regulator [Gorillibacterium sp. sgz5001074]|uniref:LysR family transcriptional regulator n=1 Tax=Gorillibacterium sp. sgz5001074 TaxID=3446695 RepID=UPI003F66732F